MSPVEALQLALGRETEAHDLYLRLAREHPNLKDLFESLVIEEDKHKKLLEKKILELTT
ncbi:MAG: ferritin family protein [Candidatus Omnitrophota bacterium]